MFFLENFGVLLVDLCSVIGQFLNDSGNFFQKKINFFWVNSSIYLISIGRQLLSQVFSPLVFEVVWSSRV